MKIAKLVKILLIGLAVFLILSFGIRWLLVLRITWNVPFLGGTIYTRYYGPAGGCFDVCPGKITELYCRPNNHYTDFVPITGPCVYYCQGELSNTCDQKTIVMRGGFSQIIVDEIKKDGWDLKKRCTEKRTCGDLVELDCNSAVDGPLYYIDMAKQKIIEKCGGWCHAPQELVEPYCKECPPKIWKCQ